MLILCRTGLVLRRGNWVGPDPILRNMYDMKASETDNYAARIMRTLCAIHIFCEVDENRFANNRVSAALVGNDGLRAYVQLLYAVSSCILYSSMMLILQVTSTSTGHPSICHGIYSVARVPRMTCARRRCRKLSGSMCHCGSG